MNYFIYQKWLNRRWQTVLTPSCLTSCQIDPFLKTPDTANNDSFTFNGAIASFFDILRIVHRTPLMSLASFHSTSLCVCCWRGASFRRLAPRLSELRCSNRIKVCTIPLLHLIRRGDNDRVMKIDVPISRLCRRMQIRGEALLLLPLQGDTHTALDLHTRHAKHGALATMGPSEGGRAA